MSKKLLLLWLEGWIWVNSSSCWQQEFMVTFHTVTYIVSCDQTDESILSFAITYPDVCESKETVRELNTHPSISTNHITGDYCVWHFSDKWPHKVNISATRNCKMFRYVTNQNSCELFNLLLSDCFLKLINMFKKHLFYYWRSIFSKYHAEWEKNYSCKYFNKKCPAKLFC